MLCYYAPKRYIPGSAIFVCSVCARLATFVPALRSLTFTSRPLHQSETSYKSSTIVRRAPSHISYCLFRSAVYVVPFLRYVHAKINCKQMVSGKNAMEKIEKYIWLCNNCSFSELVKSTLYNLSCATINLSRVTINPSLVRPPHFL